MTTVTTSQFQDILTNLGNEIFATAKEKGFWPERELTTEELTDSIIALWKNLGSKPVDDEKSLRKVVSETCELSRDCVGPSVGEKVSLIMCELAEIVEAYRAGDPPAEHLKGFRASEEEAADVLIRLLDFARHEGMRLAEAVEAKMAYNKGRPFKHNKAF